MTDAVRILVVDDEAAFRGLMKQSLEMAGYEVELADNGKSALERFEQRIFDMVITDWNMPQMNGIELIAQIRRRQPNQPVLLVTGYVSGSVAQGNRNASADAMLFKPFSIQELYDTVNRVLGVAS